MLPFVYFWFNSCHHWIKTIWGLKGIQITISFPWKKTQFSWIFFFYTQSAQTSKLLVNFLGKKPPQWIAVLCIIGPLIPVGYVSICWAQRARKGAGSKVSDHRGAEAQHWHVRVTWVIRPVMAPGRHEPCILILIFISSSHKGHFGEEQEGEAPVGMTSDDLLYNQFPSIHFCCY